MSTPRKTPSQQRSRFTYDTILEAAAHVFEREGIAATTNRIAAKAGVSIGSVYQYFPDKQALLHELALRHLDHAEAAFTEALDDLLVSRPETGIAIARLVGLAVRENSPMERLHRLLRERAPRTPELEQRFERFRATLADRFLAYLEPADQDRDELHVRVRMLVAALDSQVHDVVLDSPTPAERDRRTELAIEYASHTISRGAGNPVATPSCDAGAVTAPTVRIEPDDVTRPEVLALLAEHLRDMHATSPPESVHALDVAALRHPDVSVWTAWSADELLGCAALKHLDATHGEIKSMRTTPAARGQGVATRLLERLVGEAERRGYRRLSLETGAEPFFEPARALYRKHGFTECPPFADYDPDPNSVFFTRAVGDRAAGPLADGC